MLRLTKLTDYGIVLMTYMATSDVRVHTSAGLSEATRLPLPTVSKILQILLHGGFLQSTRGANGGYSLAKSAESISMRELIDVLEGSIALTECNLDECDCEQMPHCANSANWQRINDAVRQVLSTISLAEMAEPGFLPIFKLERATNIPIQTSGQS